jgi:hypothetical protein
MGQANISVSNHNYENTKSRKRFLTGVSFCSKEIDFSIMEDGSRVSLAFSHRHASRTQEMFNGQQS